MRTLKPRSNITLVADKESWPLDTTPHLAFPMYFLQDIMRHHEWNAALRNTYAEFKDVESLDAASITWMKSDQSREGLLPSPPLKLLFNDPVRIPPVNLNLDK
jgi:hypothetical protein